MNEYVVLNKKYEVVFKTEHLVDLHGYICRLYKEELYKKYANKYLAFCELEQFADEYKTYLDLQCWDFEENAPELRECLHELGLIVAF